MNEIYFIMGNCKIIDWFINEVGIMWIVCGMWDIGVDIMLCWWGCV